eukprot:6689661-Lingulodinium_polyedra.AAC.1
MDWFNDQSTDWLMCCCTFQRFLTPFINGKTVPCRRPTPIGDHILWGQIERWLDRWVSRFIARLLDYVMSDGSVVG